jgi:hypothetical protein
MGGWRAVEGDDEVIKGDVGVGDRDEEVAWVRMIVLLQEHVRMCRLEGSCVFDRLQFVHRLDGVGVAASASDDIRHAYTVDLA